jgi:hypothetical protein
MYKLLVGACKGRVRIHIEQSYFLLYRHYLYHSSITPVLYSKAVMFISFSSFQRSGNRALSRWKGDCAGWFRLDEQRIFTSRLSRDPAAESPPNKSAPLEILSKRAVQPYQSEADICCPPSSSPCIYIIPSFPSIVMQSPEASTSRLPIPSSTPRRTPSAKGKEKAVVSDAVETDSANVAALPRHVVARLRKKSAALNLDEPAFQQFAREYLAKHPGLLAKAARKTRKVEDEDEDEVKEWKSCLVVEKPSNAYPPVWTQDGR